MGRFIHLLCFTALLFLMLITNSQAQKLNKDGHDYLTENQYQFAKGCFENQLKLDPLDVTAQIGLGNSLLALQNSDKAKMLFRKVLDLDAKNYQAMIGLGLVAWYNHDLAGEIEYFDRARRSDKGNADIYCAIVTGCLAVTPKDTVSALIYLKQGLDLFPKNGRLHLLTGDLESAKQRYGLAANAYERAIFFDPKSYLPYRKLGAIQLLSRSYREAITSLNQSIAIEPEQILGYRFLGETYYAIGKYQEAENNYQSYLEKAESDEEAEEQFALVLFFNKKFKEAEKLLEQLNEINNQPAILLRLRGYIAYETGEYAKARELLSQYFTLQDPSKVIAPDNSYFANTLVKLGEEEMARSYFKRAALLDPTKLEPYEALAKLSSKSGSHAESAGYYQKMMELGADRLVSNFLAAKELYLEGERWRSKLDSATAVAKKGAPPTVEMIQWKGMLQKYYALSDSAFTVVTKLNSQYAGSYIWKGRIKSILDPEALTTGAKDEYEKALTLLEKTDPAKNVKSIIECYKYLGSYYYLGYERHFKSDKKLAGENRLMAINCFSKIKELDPADPQARDVLKKMNDPK